MVNLSTTVATSEQMVTTAGDNQLEIGAGGCEKQQGQDTAGEKVYSYDEAIHLAGTGCYNWSLLVALSLALLAMALDMFSFALVVTLSACDLQLDHFRNNVLVSMPFVGPIIMAYAWGYLSDTRGRRISLVVALTVSFIMSTLGAFSPHWSMLAFCRLVSTCFCSCAQSATFPLLGESCSERVKGAFMLVMTSIIHLNLAIYYPLAYWVTSLDFSYNLGFITFVPWRLLILILALPLGVSALLLRFFYESPKFLLNVGKDKKALNKLGNIYSRNGGDIKEYPVKRVILAEAGNVKISLDEKSLLQSMWEQTVPLFKPPLLMKTLLLYYLIFALYSTNSALFVWLPFFAKAFSDGMDSGSNKTLKGREGLCEMIHRLPESDIVTYGCDTTIDLPIVVAAIGASFSYCILSALTSKLAARKRLVMMTVFYTCFACGVGSVAICNNVSSVILYFGILLNSLNMGIVFSYCVDLYPTSFRGMAACLGVMVARVSGIAGVNITGPYITTHCEATFAAVSFLMLSAGVMSHLMPRDSPKTI